jgi:hypothetical protein
MTELFPTSSIKRRRQELELDSAPLADLLMGRLAEEHSLAVVEQQ